MAATLSLAGPAEHPAAAQSFTSFEFSFSNPGARGLGFGGAFVALAEDDTLARALFAPGSDELHVAGGLGVACRRFQADLAADLSDRSDTVSLSFIYSFGGQGP